MKLFSETQSEAGPSPVRYATKLKPKTPEITLYDKCQPPIACIHGQQIELSINEAQYLRLFYLAELVGKVGLNSGELTGETDMPRHGLIALRSSLNDLTAKLSSATVDDIKLKSDQYGFRLEATVNYSEKAPTITSRQSVTPSTLTSKPIEELEATTEPPIIINGQESKAAPVAASKPQSIKSIPRAEFKIINLDDEHLQTTHQTCDEIIETIISLKNTHRARKKAATTYINNLKLTEESKDFANLVIFVAVGKRQSGFAIGQASTADIERLLEASTSKNNPKLRKPIKERLEILKNILANRQKQEAAPTTPLIKRKIQKNVAQNSLPTLPAQPEWVEDAKCLQAEPDTFFPEKGGSTRESKRICAMCTVSSECLEYALENDERFGIWGGKSERERRKLKRAAS